MPQILTESILNFELALPFDQFLSFLKFSHVFFFLDLHPEASKGYDTKWSGWAQTKLNRFSLQ